MKLKIFILAISLNLISCASYFLKRDCENTNWFEYGEKLALAGKRVNEDNFVQKCRKADAEIAESQLDKGFKKGRDSYCKPQGAFLTGKRGEYLQEELCAGLNLTQIKNEHQRGVKEFCSTTNGYSAGATGNEYNNICPKELEANFLKEFNRGRKKFLAASIQAKEAEILDSDRVLKNHLQRKGMIDGELRYLMFLDFAPANTNMDARKRRESLKSDAQQVDRQIQQEETRQSSLRSEIQQLRIKMESLDTPPTQN